MLRRPLAIAVAQPFTRAYGIAANASAHAALVRAAAARVVVFPELSLTGYHFDAPALAGDDPRLALLVDACVETGAIAFAGAPVRDADGRHIAVLAIDRTGVRVAYRKMWLGGAEAEHFEPGPAPAVLDVDGWRIGLAVCRDTGVAQHAADTAALGIDVYAAGVLETEDDAHIIEERACRIAAAHSVWVAVASFAGSTGEGYDEAAGRSGIWSPEGEPLARASLGAGEWVRAELTER